MYKVELTIFEDFLLQEVPSLPNDCEAFDFAPIYFFYWPQCHENLSDSFATPSPAPRIERINQEKVLQNFHIPEVDFEQSYFSCQHLLALYFSHL